MALQYISIPEKDLGAGIDQLSAENAIPEGYSELLVNFDPRPEGSLAKRAGYQGYGGFMPVRVDKIEYSGTDISFFMDSSVDISSIDLSSLRSTPIIAYGRTSSSHSEGDWDDTDSVHYYPGLSADARIQFLTGSNTETILGTEHGKGQFLFVGTSESTSATDNSNSQFIPDDIEVSQLNDDISVKYVNNTGSAFPGFIYVADKSPDPGTTFVSSPITHPAGVTTVSTFTAGTHGLSNFNIQVQAFEDTGFLYRKVLCETTLAPDGTVTTSILNNTSSSIDFIFILTASPVLNSVTGSAAANSTVSVVINDIEKDFLFVSCYLEQTIGGTLEQVIPDSIVVDSLARTATITFQNSSSLSANFLVNYEYAIVNTNKLTVTGSAVVTPYTEEDVQISLWGLDHRLIYGTNTTATRAGWVNHIDSYRSAGENKLISGLGGNLYEAGPRETFGTDYLIPFLYPNIRERVASDVVIGPAFVDSTNTSSRTRGYIQFDGAGEGFAKGTTVTWLSGNQVKYTLSTPTISINGTLSTIISNTAGLEDYLTVEQSGYPVNSGTFKILSVTSPDANTLEITVENEERDSADFDETDAGMECGVFTDRITLLSTSPFIPDDQLLSDFFSEDSSFTVTGVDGAMVVVDGVTEEFSIPGGLRVVARRQSNLIPLRELDGTSTVENIVQGDLIKMAGTSPAIERELRVKYVITADDENVAIDGDGTTATITSLTDTSIFWIGQTILLKQAGVYSGHQVITLVGADYLEFASEETAVEAGILAGKLIQIDETLTVEDTVGSSISVSVPRRWIPIEAPDDTFDLTPNTYFRHFDTNTYSEQAIARSVMVADNMYFANGADEILKYDGTNVYRAGLFRWQPHLFVVTDTTPPAPETGEIVVNLPSSTPTAVDNNEFKVPIGDELKFKVGKKIRHSYSGGFDDYTIVNLRDDGTDGFIQVEAFKTITLGTSPLLRGVGVYRYYFRLNAIDANQNIIASAVTGAQDFVVQLAETAQVRMRLTGLPAWDIYDYDRLEVEIYRTKLDGVAPFYRIVTLPMSFNNDDGYLDYIDTDSDDVLKDLDIVNTALLGAELGQTWTDPLRAKYITSAGNKLVLGNIKDYPKIDIQLVDTGVRIDASVLNNQVYTFRKDNRDTGNTTNMVDTVRYQLRSTGAVTITPNTDIAVGVGSFTVTSLAHGAVAGDWVYLFHSAVEDGNSLKFSGWFQIASVTTDDFTVLYDMDSYTPTADDVDRFLLASTSKDVPVWLGTDGNYSQINGNADLSLGYEFYALRRLANAINTSMRRVNVNVITGFTPWLIANAGSEYNFGQIIITQPRVFDSVFECQLPTFSGFNIFANGVKRASDGQVSALTSLFPSRIIVSYPNYPEIMDNPTSILDTDSESAIDVNPADGQEITGIIPFYGESSFGAAQKDSIIVVFKTNSIYIVNLAAKAAGSAAVQKLESRGLGCTAPFSIAPTQNGIMFANESGIYRLDRQMQIDYIGRKLERFWKENINRQHTDVMTGHYYSFGNKYKLSVPVSSDDSPTTVLVYDTTREYVPDGYRAGSWTTYDNHPSIGWANLLTDAFFASTFGQVFTLRTTGLKYDYRDDDQAVGGEEANTYAILRAMDFGDGSVRKAIQSIVMQFRDIVSTDGTTVQAAPNLTEAYEDLDSFQIIKPSDQQSSIGDEADIKVQTIKFVIDRRKVVYTQIKVINNTKDEPLEISGITYRVAGLSNEGVTEAAQTK